MQHSEAVHSASRVVLSTLIEAADRDYRLYVLSDGTEDPDQQARDVLLGRIFPAAGAGHRHRHAARAAVAVDSRP
jgi:nicotinamidase-related amidase